MEIPTGGVVPSAANIEKINRYVEGGTMSRFEATYRVLGVFPDKVFFETVPEDVPMDETQTEASDSYDHISRVTNLVHMLRVGIGLSPKIARLATVPPDERGALLREIKRDQALRDNFMEQACVSCPRQDDCDEIKGKGWEGMQDVHPQLTESAKFGIIGEKEPMNVMIVRVVPNPKAHCNPEKDEIAISKNEETKPIVIDGSGMASLNVPFVDEEVEFLYEKRNEHLDKAIIALNARNRAKALAQRGNPRLREKRESNERDKFKLFISEIMQACQVCPDNPTCPLASSPRAWDQAHHYKDKAPYGWESREENGIGHETRTHFDKRRAKDPTASCVPPKRSLSDRPTPKPDPGLPNAA
ncbi:hypothetical protein A3F37_01070 [Candidatus Saccharibacteria bacterium RIFCSPHIGHO2_12_FULL_41_12]|nr:MAG: hypothetical protein A3F37_01070 [Candidatus Saccharibacteria bacterium RIFCSPHIGHO2_12_FULL_41_12]